MKLKSVICLCFGLMMAAAAISPLRAQNFAQNFAQADKAPVVILPPDVAFARFIALIRGHLLTADQLVAQRQYDVAQPHFRFPTEEIYGVIRAELRDYKTPAFDGLMKNLARTANARGAKQYPAALQKVEAALAAADANLRTRQPNWPRFIVTVAIEVLKTAPDEYDDAVVKGRIVRPIGYQTARGFILQADRMIESVAADFSGDNAAAVADIRGGITQLKAVFTDVKASKQAPIDTTALDAMVAGIEKAAAKIT
ncbi:MAG: hypothetical protein ABI830_06020 [Pseudolabrys sp.]